MSWATRMADWGDRLPPVLIKEVRQALRGRAFVVPFLLAVFLACLLTWRWSLDQGRSPDGQSLLAMLTGVLLMPAAFLVPFSAFQTMGAEWDEGTIEQLQLSTLSPLSMAAGKLWAAMVQVALYLSAFAPFVTLSAVAGGVGPSHVLNALTQVVLVSLSLSAWALALGTFARHRAARGVMLFLLLTLGFQLIRVPLSGMFDGRGVFTQGLEELVYESVAFGIVPAVAGLAVAATRLAHPATNTSTPLRLTTTVVSLVALLAVTGQAWSAGLDQRQYGTLVAFVVLAISLCALFFTTEPEKLPRPVRAQLVARRGERPFEVFWLPGGGRGVAWFWLHGLVLISLASVFGVGLRPRLGGTEADVILPGIVVFLLANAYILLPATALAGWNTNRNRRVIVRWLPIALSLGFLVLAGLVRVVTGSDAGLTSVLNPFLLYRRTLEGGMSSGYILLVGFLGLAGAVPSLARASAGILEVRAARKQAPRE